MHNKLELNALYGKVAQTQPFPPKSATFEHFPFAACIKLLWYFVMYQREWTHDLNEDGSITSERKRTL